MPREDKHCNKIGVYSASEKREVVGPDECCSGKTDTLEQGNCRTNNKCSAAKALTSGDSLQAPAERILNPWHQLLELLDIELFDDIHGDHTPAPHSTQANKLHNVLDPNHPPDQ